MFYRVSTPQGIPLRDGIPIVSLPDGEFKVAHTCAIHIAPIGGEFVIPKGFITDLASVPRMLRWIVRSAVGDAPIIHDYFYRTRSEKVPRVVADAIFLAVLKQQKVRLALWKYYLPVRLFGWLSWKKR